MNGPKPRQNSASSPAGIADLIPDARRTYPAGLVVDDELFAANGTTQAVVEVRAMHEGKAITALQADGHRAWFWNSEPITAILHRAKTPTVTYYSSVLDPSDDDGWANGDPAVIDTETESIAWEPDDGDPIRWAVDALDERGTTEPSSSPPSTERTWYSTTWTDWSRGGATVDVSAHLSGFTRAEAEDIGAGLTAHRAPARPTTAARGTDPDLHRGRIYRDSAAHARLRAVDDGIGR